MLTNIKGFGPKTIDELNKENVHSIDELLFTFPSSYEVYSFDESKIFTGEYTCIRTMLAQKPAFFKYRPNVYAFSFYVYLGEYKLKCCLFSGEYLIYKLKQNTPVILYGRYKNESREFIVKKIFFDDFSEKITVQYPYKNIKSSQIQNAIQQIRDTHYQVEETLPKELISKYKLYSLEQMVYAAHLPQNKEELRQIDRRRKYEEFFWYEMSFSLLRSMRSKHQKKPRIPNKEILNHFIESLPFTLTKGQMDAIVDCDRDLSSPIPMNRLIQGDVGCGKTLVAFYAIFYILSSGYQGALMLPTELLAQQQFEALKGYAEEYGYRISMLSSSTKKKEKNQILLDLKEGRIQVIVGTHSLLEDAVTFHNLGLVVIDEQHRFGVLQRQKLIEKYKDVDALYMSATPIPRTLGLSRFGDLEISSIETMPKGRIPITTKILDYTKWNPLLRSIEKRILLGEQVYVVVPMVIENEDLDCITVNEALSMIESGLPDIKAMAITGKMSAEKKKEVMNSFLKNETQLLVSTTVIEVGVNVPNATVMVILDAERFGLAQMHQLRGRVGRGNKESFCILVSKDTTNPRLKVLESITDGFGIAEEDFKLRGPGNYFGSEQSGYTSFEYADLKRDKAIWENAKKDAQDYFDKFSSGAVISIRYNHLILENAKNGFKSN